MIRIVFYTSVIVFFLLWPVNGMTAGLKSTANQNLQHYSDNTLADCVAEVAPETDLLSFQKKYRHKAEKKCHEMLAEKRRKTAVITPDADAETVPADGKTVNTADAEAAQDTENKPASQSRNYWRNNTAD
ncbi:MAG: hypothetical protein HND56_03100 [Pseudomonadota bacterium]|nr:hypothetical protein [Pseudomonadota bacterium]QKK04735.1 MAG: hypothetical protein HND56_03100 [Pseudomonadota bacterium]